MNKRWRIKEKNISKAEKIAKKYNLSNLVSKIIANKNLNDDEIEKFLNPTRKDFYDPFLMPDMDKAIDRIERAIKEKEKIIIYGDYDADGITSTVILKRFFKDRGIELDTYIPNRLNEGYGLNKNAVEKIAKDGYTLMITVDCGITSIEEVELAKKLGLDVVVTDHHETLDQLPNAVAVIDCKRKDNEYPFEALAGCGVAFKLIQAYCMRLDINENECLKYLDIACVGTISDIVPLVDENRVIAKLGLLLINQTKNLGLKEILNLSGYKNINSTAISFGVSPRINACGRMGHQEIALKLLLTDDPIEARNYAKELEEYNKQRQDIEKKIYEEAVIQAEKNIDKPCLILGKENWHHGVIGIVSSKITDKYYKPSILLCFENDEAKGSGRSIKGFDLHKAVVDCSKYLKNFGGHSMAIGLNLEQKNYEKFKEQFEEYTKENLKEVLTPELDIDEEITYKDINKNSVNDLKLLEPFGESNAVPQVLYKNIKIVSIRTLSEGKHLKLTLQDDNTIVDAIGFNLGELANNYLIGDKIDVVGNLELNNYNNIESIQINLKDLRKSVS